MSTSEISAQPAKTVAAVRAELVNAPAVDARTLAAAERGLKVSAILTIAFGLMFAIGTTDATDSLQRLFGDIAFLRVGDGIDQLSDHNHLSNAIAGGIMVGWAAMTWMLADRLLHVVPREAKRLLLVALACWFVVDSAGSIASGAWFNVVMNAGFYAMFWFPVRKI